MSETMSVDYGTQRLTLADAQAAVLTRLLSRLPADLWNTDPEALTLQRDLYRAIAGEVARWLESRTVATPMTLLTDAQGLDLDRLLRDYGLRRYFQRPDAFAQQIGLHCLFIPKATFFAVERLADLLLAVPHVTRQTGPGEVHTFVAQTRPVVAPYTYWQLVDDAGQLYAVTIHGGVPLVSRMPPPGLNTTPGGGPLAWFTVWDTAHALWYVALRGDSLWTTPTVPPGHGTSAPFQVLDHTQGWWTLSADQHGVLVSSAVTSANTAAYLRLQPSSGPVVAVYVEGQVATYSATLPGGRDVTPTSAPLDWFAAWDATDALWSVQIDAGTFVTQRGALPGVGTDAPLLVPDAQGALWALGITASGALLTTLVAPAPAPMVTQSLLDPAHPYEACQLVDSAGTPWWLAIQAGAGVLWPALPGGALDVTPPGGPYRWLRLTDLQGQLWYGFPEPLGTWTTSRTTPGGRGTKDPQTLGDAQGVQWHYGIDPTGVFATSQRPSAVYAGLASTLILHDAQGVPWCWRVTRTNGVAFFEVGAVVWDDAVPTSPWGALSWLLVRTLTGAARYVFPHVYTGVPVVGVTPPEGGWWGWSEDIAFVDQQGTAYALSVTSGDVLAFAALPPDDIPLPQPTLPLRDFHDAMVHVRAQGTVVTLSVA